MVGYQLVNEVVFLAERNQLKCGPAVYGYHHRLRDTGLPVMTQSRLCLT